MRKDDTKGDLNLHGSPMRRDRNGPVGTATGAASFADYCCDKAEDRMYHAEDGTWWQRVGNRWRSAEPPNGWRRSNNRCNCPRCTGMPDPSAPPGEGEGGNAGITGRKERSE